MTHTVDARMEALFDEIVVRHGPDPALISFCQLPDDITPQACEPHHIPAAQKLADETGFASAPRDPLADFFLNAGPAAHWRETYKDSGLPDAFLNVFGCWCLIGSGGPYRSDHIASYMLYMPAGLWYPWHHHPGEEMYSVLAGGGEFFLSGEEPRHLGVGDSVVHGANQPHALQTHDQPILCYVVWRNGFGIKPVLTPPDRIDAPLGSPHLAR